MDEQECFWSNNFGDEYTERNNENLIKNNENLFNKIIKNININSLFEIGCNRGLNFFAINNINKDILLNGLELNKKAYNILLNKNICNQLYND